MNDLTSHLTSALFTLCSNRHNASLHSDRRIPLLLHLSRSPEVLWPQDRQGEAGQHQTAGPGIYALAVRPAPADDDATTEEAASIADA